MRYRVSNLPLWLDEDESRLVERAAERLGVSPEHVSDLLVVRRSLDARKKGHARWLVNVEVTVAGEVRAAPPDVAPVPPAEPPPPLRAPPRRRGRSCSARGRPGSSAPGRSSSAGSPSVVVDRGKPVGPRRQDVAALMRGGALDPESNMNFGEGGAGAYTDGKLGTRIHHPAVRKVVELFARFGNAGADPRRGKAPRRLGRAPRRDLRDARGARAGRLHVRVERARGRSRARRRTLPGAAARGRADASSSDRLVLAPGNSARELFELFAARGWPIEAKAFAAGFRAEHPQALIDRIQYGTERRHPKLPPADYRLADNPKIDGRGARRLLVLHVPGRGRRAHADGARDAVHERDVELASLVAARERRDRRRGVARGLRGGGVHGPARRPRVAARWEREAYRLGGGGYRAPAQRLAGVPRREAGRAPGADVVPAGRHGRSDLSALYPPRVQEALRAGLAAFGRRMRGFVTEEALLLGVETRTSSPCRLVRGERLPVARRCAACTRPARGPGTRAGSSLRRSTGCGSRRRSARSSGRRETRDDALPRPERRGRGAGRPEPRRFSTTCTSTGSSRDDDLVRSETSTRWVRAGSLPALHGVRERRADPRKVPLLVVAGRRRSRPASRSCRGC